MGNGVGSGHGDHANCRAWADHQVRAAGSILVAVTSRQPRFRRYIVNTMRRIHRLAGLLSALSLIASVVVTSGFACKLPGGADRMAGMAMTNAPNPPSPAASVGSIAGEAPAPASAPCELPWAPSACQSMVPCAPAAVAAQRVGIPTTSGVVLRVASAAVLTPPSETIAPELPPPRA